MSKTNIVSLAGVAGGFLTFGEQHEAEQRTTKMVLEMHEVSKATGADPLCGVVVFATDGRTFRAAGNADSHPVITAIEDARMAGLGIKSIAVSVADNRAHNPLPEDALEALSEFDGLTVLLVGIDKSVAIGQVKNSIAA